MVTRDNGWVYPCSAENLKSVNLRLLIPFVQIKTGTEQHGAVILQLLPFKSLIYLVSQPR